MARINDPNEIAAVLKSAKTIAVVGCSPDESRPSNSIARYLISAGFDVLPVNPGHDEMLGRRCYRELAAIPADVKVDVVDVFRRSEQVGPIADQAVARGVGFFWMQDGIQNDEAARKLVEAGIGVAMNRCIYREHSALARRPG